MADQFEEMMPNQAANKEKAEGSRENVNLGTDANHPNLGTGADNPMERGSGQVSQPDKPVKPQSQGGKPDSDNAGGITNRPLSEEQKEEAQLPPRGGTKHGGHAS